jgi:hypothetical protein
VPVQQLETREMDGPMKTSLGQFCAIGTLGALTIATVTTGITYAATSSGSSVQACANSAHVLALETRGKCPRHFAKVTISKAGPRGAQGVAGPPGAEGDPGPRGFTGAAAPGSTVITFTGSTGYTVPAGVTDLRVELWGGGGGGGGADTDSDPGAGGGSGAYGLALIPVTEGESCRVTAGNGGEDGAEGSTGGINGNETTIACTPTVPAADDVAQAQGGHAGTGITSPGDGGSTATVSGQATLLASSAGEPGQLPNGTSGGSGGTGGGAGGAGGDNTTNENGVYGSDGLVIITPLLGS